jgi:hypothetical protein
MNYIVKRNQEIIGCEIDARSKEDAITIAVDNWSYNNFGQAGAMTESQLATEREWLRAEFTAYTEIEIQFEELLTTAETLKKIVLIQNSMLVHWERVAPGIAATLIFNEDWLKMKLELDTLKYKIENEL